ncbi:hypothetical protein [Clostridium thermosuccinogenes]|jgi:dephospho-CoA kinase|uniref:hypothetical protein n=1 Tax=Clostridium thermosuccinogenes TaxID=84032 RepID=UPI000CCBDFC9|nr:hypothetical protein [Pseudoclostridium thermosuccinogenes]PNT92249.1 hypothetical protein CDQ83_01345 [Pseudoclostridium thermosuccinogenes]
MTTIERALNSIGKKCFVDYYEDFRSCTDKDALARKLLANNKNATSLSAQMTRINYAQWIFENKKEKEALDIIIRSNRLDDITIKKAREYLDSL